MRRLAQEHADLSNSLPLTPSSSVWARAHSGGWTACRSSSRGPRTTPYSAGLFLFDAFFPAAYPTQSPKVNLQTTGNNTVRFNPNLYNCGKVCLSLLGTWEGQEGETWNERTSTFLQVLVSVQSLIFVPEPYFNEPGYEQQMGTQTGAQRSKSYSAEVRENTLRWAMLNQLRHPPNGFEKVVKAHFYLRRELVRAQLDGWEAEATQPSRISSMVREMKAELDKLDASCLR